MSFLKHNKQKSNYLGKIATFGPAGSGKTHLITRIINDITLENTYLGDEEQELAGISNVANYHLDFRPYGRFIMHINSNYSTLRQISELMKNLSDIYQGLIIVLDAIGWNFRNIAKYQADQLRHFSNYLEIPICLMVNKRDLAEIILKNYIDDISEIIDQTMKQIHTWRKLHYFNYTHRQINFIKLTKLNIEAISFPIFEQILVYILDKWNRKVEVPGMTNLNVRILIRSLLLALLEIQSPNVVTEELKNCLNYYRPTSYETEITWTQMMAPLDKKMQEPVFDATKITTDIIKTLLLDQILANEEKVKQFYDELQNLTELSKWNVVNYCYTDSITREGRKVILDTFTIFLKEVATRADKMLINQEKKDLEITDLGLNKF